MAEKAEMPLEQKTMQLPEPKNIEMPLQENTMRLPQLTPKKAIKTSFTIFRAAPSICKSTSELYGPRMVPIGPYHCDNNDLASYMSCHKTQFLDNFLSRNSAVMNEEVYVEKIRDLHDSVHECYSEKVKCSKEVLQRMILHDGCFILEFLLKLHNEEHDAFLQRGWDPVAILSDLLLLENQIPFFILQELYTIVKKDNPTSVNLPDLKVLVLKNLFNKYLNDGIRRDAEKVCAKLKDTHHLLHLYHQLSKPKHERKAIPPPTQKKYNVPQVIPSASQLIEFGIRLEKKRDSNNIHDATFNNCLRSHHHLAIPQLVIDPTRRTLLMNLLAFEKCLKESKQRWTGLMILINCIMKTKQDLDILQRAGIVLNLFPSEDEAIKFVGQLSEQVTIDFNNHYYSHMFGEIAKHCDKRFARFRATFMHQYFSNPWALITFTLSVFGFTLSAVQTLISVSTYNRNRLHH